VQILDQNIDVEHYKDPAADSESARSEKSQAEGGRCGCRVPAIRV